jgi:hypothetical protein
MILTARTQRELLPHADLTNKFAVLKAQARATYNQRNFSSLQKWREERVAPLGIIAILQRKQNTCLTRVEIGGMLTASQILSSAYGVSK